MLFFLLHTLHKVEYTAKKARKNERKGREGMGLTLAVVSLVLSVISIALLAYDVGEKRGFRDGYEIGKAERHRESANCASGGKLKEGLESEETDTEMQRKEEGREAQCQG